MWVDFDYYQSCCQFRGKKKKMFPIERFWIVSWNWQVSRNWRLNISKSAWLQKLVTCCNVTFIRDKQNTSISILPHMFLITDLQSEEEWKVIFLSYESYLMKLLINPHPTLFTDEKTEELWTKIVCSRNQYEKAVYCLPVYLTYMQSASCEMPGWMKFKLESIEPGEIYTTPDIQLIPFRTQHL